MSFFGYREKDKNIKKDGGLKAFGGGIGFKYNGFGQICRYFTTLDGASDYYTIPTFELSGDFILEANISTTDTASNKMVLGNSDTGINYMGIVSNAFYLRLDETIINHPANLEDGKFHNMKCVRASGSIEFFVDNISIGVTANTDTITLDRIGAYNVDNLKFNGVISDVKITDGTDLIRYYKIDEDLSATSTIIDSGSDGSNGAAVSITSSELFTLEGADWEASNIWTHGNVSAVAAASGFVGTSSVTVISGLKYKFYYDVANYVNGSTVASITATGTSRTANGSYTDIITATGTSAGWSVTTNPTTLDIENGIIKRILQAP